MPCTDACDCAFELVTANEGDLKATADKIFCDSNKGICVPINRGSGEDKMRLLGAGGLDGAYLSDASSQFGYARREGCHVHVSDN
jgi:hypothetical protein